MKLKYQIEKNNQTFYASTLDDLATELGMKLSTLKWQLKNKKCDYIKKLESDLTLREIQDNNIPYTINKNAILFLVDIDNTTSNINSETV